MTPEITVLENLVHLNGVLSAPLVLSGFNVPAIPRGAGRAGAPGAHRWGEAIQRILVHHAAVAVGGGLAVPAAGHRIAVAPPGVGRQIHGLATALLPAECLQHTGPSGPR